jgi:uncharacterized protein YjbI with pentapeptide repeats
MNRDELLRRYEAGERDFSGVNLSGADISCRFDDFDDCQLLDDDDVLDDSDLSDANANTVIFNGYLDKINLRDANLSSANLSGASMIQQIAGI